MQGSWDLALQITICLTMVLAVLSLLPFLYFTAHWYLTSFSAVEEPRAELKTEPKAESKKAASRAPKKPSWLSVPGAVAQDSEFLDPTNTFTERASRAFGLALGLLVVAWEWVLALPRRLDSMVC